MRRFGWLLLAASIGFGLSSGLVNAAPLPEGSYRDTCKSARASGGVLRAYCEQRHGRLLWARLERYKTCVGDVLNDQGRLICLRREELPGGTWRQNCRNPHLAAPGMFGADCRSPSGGRIASRIPLDACPGGLTSVSGHLTCDKPRSRSVERTAPPSPPPPPAPPSSSAPDQDEDEQPATPHPDQALPPGNYQATCRDLDFDGRYLSGECRDHRDAYQDTSLDTHGCARDQQIGNDNGELVCARPQAGREVPDGIYRQSCRKLTFDGRFLRGECRDGQGAWDKATLDMRPCHNGDAIANEDGELVCKRGQIGAPVGGEHHDAPTADQHHDAPSPGKAP